MPEGCYQNINDRGQVEPLSKKLKQKDACVEMEKDKKKIAIYMNEGEKSKK